MQAIRVHQWGGPDVLQYETVPDPPAPQDGEVLIAVKAVGVNPVDTYVRSGTYAALPALPYTPGSDASGIILAVGPNCGTLAPGDAVYTAGTITGAYAEKALVKAENVLPLPENVTFEQGAGIWVPYGTAYRALVQRAQGKAGEAVLVHGASGGVGLAAVQIAHYLGLTVWGTASTPEGREVVRAQGADFVLDHGQESHLADGKAQTTNGAGWNVILEMLANVNLGRDLPNLAPSGRVVIVGNRGTVEINPRDLMGRDAAILGMSLGVASLEDTASIHAALQAGLKSGALSPIVGHTYDLADAQTAHRDIINPPKGAQGKMVLVPKT